MLVTFYAPKMLSMSQPKKSAKPIWQHIPLYGQIMIALVLAVGLGILLGAGEVGAEKAELINHLTIPCTLVLKALRALATPLIFLAVLHSFLTASIPGRSGRRLAFLLLTNTLVAILVGLFVANVLRPGTWSRLSAPSATSEV